MIAIHISAHMYRADELHVPLMCSHNTMENMLIIWSIYLCRFLLQCGKYDGHRPHLLPDFNLAYRDYVFVAFLVVVGFYVGRFY